MSARSSYALISILPAEYYKNRYCPPSPSSVLILCSVMKGDYMSRCSTCNGSTFSLVKTADLRTTDLVSQRSKREIEDFWRCKRCEKLYWAGPSVNEGMESYNKIFS